MKNNRLPIILVSSVVRATDEGDSHGGMYLINLNNEKIEKVLDWDRANINWEGRGGDRGLRGIAFWNKKIYIAASNEIFVYDKEFKQLFKFQNRYLKHCHEISVSEGKLYISSTGFDSILIYDLGTNCFEKSFLIRYKNQTDFQNNWFFKQLAKLRAFFGPPEVNSFDPLSDDGPTENDLNHINNVFVNVNGNICASGTRLNFLVEFDNQGVIKNKIRVPVGTHNIMMYKSNLLINDTSKDKISYSSAHGKELKVFYIKKYAQKDMKNMTNDIIARQAFGRGLCVFGENLIIGGSSPSTISLYDFESPGKAIKTIRISNDIRNSIHGLEVWPFDKKN